MSGSENYKRSWSRAVTERVCGWGGKDLIKVASQPPAHRWSSSTAAFTVQPLENIMVKTEAVASIVFFCFFLEFLGNKYLLKVMYSWGSLFV